MSFLTPLFLLGGLAVALPILFHLVRRSTREKTRFSSLMFLDPTPPRLSKRSRIEHLLLLLLRCGIFLLLALAFARPFFANRPLPPTATEAGVRRLLLIDTSASLRRSGFWDESVSKAQEILNKARPTDVVEVWTYDQGVRLVFSAKDWSALPPGERASRAGVALRAVSPSWRRGDLAQALVASAQQLVGAETAVEGGPRKSEIVLISDLAEGSKLDSLQGYSWPERIPLSIEPIGAGIKGNAGLQWVQEVLRFTAPGTHDASAGIKVRVSNDRLSTKDQYQLRWDQGTQLTPVYVPPGQTRVVAVPFATDRNSSARLLLIGDDQNFDNQLYVANQTRNEVRLLYVGAESAADSSQPLYFLQRALTDNNLATFKMELLTDQSVATAVDAASFYFISSGSSPALDAPLRAAIRGGKSAFIQLTSASMASRLAGLFELPALKVEEAAVTNYSMLGEIDFSHPVLSFFANPKFSDFTKIHVWKYRRWNAQDLPGARVIIRMENGDPGLVQVPMGSGSVWIQSFGWQPSDSQMALSSKFVPLLFSILEQSGTYQTTVSQSLVSETLVLPVSGGWSLQKPSGGVVPVVGQSWAETDEPGLYQFTHPSAGRVDFAVNVDPVESKTATLPPEALEQRGIKTRTLAGKPGTGAGVDRLKASEQESRQKIWRWFIAAAVLFVLIETWLSSRGQRTVQDTPSIS